MKKNIPAPALNRLCEVLQCIEGLDRDGVEFVSSAVLAGELSVPAHSIRKDFCWLGDLDASKSGYEIGRLQKAIRITLGLEGNKNTCVVGLGRLGSSLLSYSGFEKSGYTIVAGFDSSVNKVETMQSAVELYPVYELESIVKRKEIDIGIIAVPAESAQQVAGKMVGCGIKGILNFAPVNLKLPEGIPVRNMNLVKELDILSAFVV